MTRFALRLGLLVVCLASSSTAFGSPIGTSNGPVDPIEKPSLQEILDDLVVSGPPIDANDPSFAELFTAGDEPVVTQLVFNFLNPGNLFAFGIYDGNDPGNLLWLFPESVSPSHLVTVSFSSDGSVAIDNAWVADTGTGFDGPFGFFIKRRNPGETPVYFFSEADLNGGTDRLKVFQGDGSQTLQFPGLDPELFLPDQFLLAWEAGIGDQNDGGFDDLIVSVKAITAVPEPAALLLLGISVGALARMRKARQY
jgi:PEP-CTERM motif